jgi:cell division protein FtsI/penicillin-binding protein 2
MIFMEKRRLRLMLFLTFLGLGFLVVLGRAAHLADLFDFSNRIPDRGSSIRGPIKDRRSISLAVTEEASTIGLAPSELLDPEFTARYLAGYLAVDSGEILKKIYLYQGRRYFLLKRQVDNFTAQQIMDLRLPGVYREFENRRVYPNGRLASNLIGFTGRDPAQALAGLEYVYNDVLNGSGYERGPTLYLTIDSMLQYRMEKALQKGFEGSGADKAVGIMMDVETGEVLAMANLPDFDPNFYYRDDAAGKGNWAIRLNFEPGSTMKVFAAAALLNERPEILKRKFVCRGEFPFQGGSVRCLRHGRIQAHGELDLSGIIEQSCNVGMIQAVSTLDDATLYKYLIELGFHQRTGVLPEGSGETRGYIPELNRWVQATRYYTPIGQGISVTPLQLLRGFSALVNGGSLLQPSLMKRIVTEEGVILDEMQIVSRPTSLRRESLQTLNRMMRAVVATGTGKAANLKEIEVIGKTGTAQKSSAAGYIDRYSTSFLGAFPASRPRYAVLILFDGVGGDQSGGGLSAPVFAEFVRSILPLIEAHAEIFDAAEYEKKKVQMQRDDSPDGEHTGAERTYRLAMKRLNAREGVLPDFRKHPVRRAIEWAAMHTDIHLTVRGSGYIFRQHPAPGTSLRDVTQLTLYAE